MVQNPGGYGLRFQEIASTSGNAGVFDEVVRLTSEIIRVQATDAADNLSGYSNVATITTAAPDTQAPTAPSGLAATAVSQKPDQGGGCTNFTQIGTPTATSFCSTGLSANWVCRFRVRAPGYAVSGPSSRQFGGSESATSAALRGLAPVSRQNRDGRDQGDAKPTLPSLKRCYDAFGGEHAASAPHDGRSPAPVARDGLSEYS